MGMKKILIVDDEPSIRALAQTMLSQDYTILMAGDGVEAIEITKSQKPDLILMDIMMPKLDGYIACYSIKNDPETKEIPVIMLTGVGHELNKKLSQQYGAEGYITKPFQLQELVQVIKEHLPD